MSQEIEQEIKEVYLDPKQPGSYGGVEALFKRCKEKGLSVTRNQVLDVLKKLEVYTLHKPRRVHYSRNPTVVGDIDQQWQADLADMQHVSTQNSGFKYILTVVDCLGKFGWAIPVKKKDAKSMVIGFRELFAQAKPRKPLRLQTDKGNEFLNKDVQNLLRQHGVKHFVTENETKASMVERFNRTLKTKMFRWFEQNDTKRYIDVLPELLHSYNHSVHRTIGMRPVDVNKSNVKKIFNRVYGKHFASSDNEKFQRKQPVRISSAKTVFDKGYLPNWTDEVFKVKESVNHPKKVYKIEDLEGEPVRGTFYPEELQAVSYDFPDKFEVETVLKNRKRKGVKEVFVKWKGYPVRYNSWIPDTELSQYGSGNRFLRQSLK